MSILKAKMRILMSYLCRKNGGAVPFLGDFSMCMEGADYGRPSEPGANSFRGFGGRLENSAG